MFDIKNVVAPFLAALWLSRRSVMTIAWLVCLAGWIGVALLPNVYTAKARMFVDTDTLLRPLMKDLAVAPDFDRQVGIMRDTLLSVPNIEELIERTDLDTDHMGSLERVQLIEKVVDDLYIKVLGRNLFEIGYEYRDPDVAYEVVSVMLDIFVQQQLGHSQRDVQIASAFIEEQIASYDNKLREAELRVAEFRRKHSEELSGAERSGRDLERTEGDMRRLKAELETAHWRRDQLRTKLDSTPKTISGAEADEAGPSPAQQQLRELNEELLRKRLIYTEQHPDILALRQLIEQAGEQVEREREEGPQITVDRVSNPLYAELSEQLLLVEGSINDYVRRINVAESESEALSDTIRLVPKVEADLKRLNRDYDVLLSQYEELTQRRESAQLARELDEGKKRIEFRTVEPPVRPLQPSGPPHGLFIMAVLVFGVGIGCAYVIGRFLMSDTVLTSAQLQSSFPNLPVLGGVSQAQGTGQLSSWLSLASSGAALIAVFATFFYFYQLSPNKPDLITITADLTDSLFSKNAQAEP